MKTFKDTATHFIDRFSMSGERFMRNRSYVGRSESDLQYYLSNGMGDAEDINNELRERDEAWQAIHWTY